MLANLGLAVQNLPRYDINNVSLKFQMFKYLRYANIFDDKMWEAFALQKLL